MRLNENALAKLNTRKRNVLDMTETGLYTLEEAQARMSKLKDEEDVLQSNINLLKRKIEIQETNHLEVRRNKLISIQSVIERIENSTEINRLYKMIIRKVDYIRSDDLVDIKVEFL